MWKTSDEELVYLYHQGAEQALDELLEKYESIVRVLAFRYGYKKNKCDIEELVQMAKIKILQALDVYRPDKEAKFSSFYQEIVRRAFIDWARKQSLRNSRMSSFTDLMIEEQEVEYYVESKRKVIHKEELSMRLPYMKEQEKEIVYLRLQGYSYQEIADMLKINRRRVGYVLQKLRTV